MKKLLVLLVLTSLSIPAFADRYVFVNSAKMNAQQLQLLDQLACAQVPNGHYWLNFANGVWGYAGNPMPQGQITGQCNNWNGVSAYDSKGNYHSLSERGMLFRPGELLR